MKIEEDEQSNEEEYYDENEECYYEDEDEDDNYRHQPSSVDTDLELAIKLSLEEQDAALNRNAIISNEIKVADDHFLKALEISKVENGFDQSLAEWNSIIGPKRNGRARNFIPLTNAQEELVKTNKYLKFAGATSDLIGGNCVINLICNDKTKQHGQGCVYVEADTEEHVNQAVNKVVEIISSTLIPAIIPPNYFHNSSSNAPHFNRPMMRHIIIDNNCLFNGAKSFKGLQDTSNDNLSRNFMTNDHSKKHFDPAIRINSKGMISLLRNGVNIPPIVPHVSPIKHSIIASKPAAHSKIWHAWRKGGFAVTVVRHPTLVDQEIATRICTLTNEHIHDPPDSNCLVLVTGNGPKTNSNLSDVIQQMAGQGWRVEIWSWNALMPLTMKMRSMHSDSRISIHWLDHHVDQIIYQSNNRHVIELEDLDEDDSHGSLCNNSSTNNPFLSNNTVFKSDRFRSQLNKPISFEKNPKKKFHPLRAIRGELIEWNTFCGSNTTTLEKIPTVLNGNNIGKSNISEKLPMVTKGKVMVNDDENDCIFCLNQPKTIMLEPCLHVVVCVTCLSYLKDCPYCGNKFTGSKNLK